VTSIEQLAQREAQAEQRKGKADKEWRAAWWATTLALGAIPRGDRKTLATAQEAVHTYTSQNLQYISKRANAGRALISLERDQLRLIPPRMAMAVVEAKLPVDAAMLARMVAADANPEIGLRDFVATETGKAWADTPEGMSRETITKIVAAQPELVADAVLRNERASNAVRAKHAWWDREQARINAPVSERVKLTPFDRDAAIIAQGGRIPSLEEINESTPLDPIIERSEQWAIVEHRYAALMAALNDFGPVGDTTAEANQLKDWAVSLVDHIASVGERGSHEPAKP